MLRATLYLELVGWLKPSEAVACVIIRPLPRLGASGRAGFARKSWVQIAQSSLAKTAPNICSAAVSKRFEASA